MIFFVDIFLIFLVGVFIYKGIKDGFIDTTCSLLAILIGLYVAKWGQNTAAVWLMKLTGWGATFSKVLVFIIIFVVINRFINWLAYLGERFLDTLTRIPFIKKLNNMLGGAVGGIIGLVAAGVIIFGVKRFGSGFLLASFDHSTIAGYISQGVIMLVPYIPTSILNF
jgi:uncharacterized membrane protein required for colicin V production